MIKPLLLKKTSRKDNLHYFIKWLIDWYLRKQSRQYLAAGKKQLIGYSFDLQMHRINLFGAYDARELSVFIEYLTLSNPESFDGEFIDIGANIGNHSIFFSNYFRKVHSFEPNKKTFSILKFNSVLANNITCYEEGLSDADGRAVLTEPYGFPGCSSITQENEPGDSIAIRKLDSIIGRFENVSLIKIDVEGHELNVLQGGVELIKKYMPYILFEQHAHEFDANGDSKVLTFIRTLGYTSFAMIREYPRANKKNSINILRYTYNAIARLILGSKIKVEIKENFLHEFYPFLIAIPPKKSK